jgi:hypothetical protein
MITGNYRVFVNSSSSGYSGASAWGVSGGFGWGSFSVGGYYGYGANSYNNSSYNNSSYSANSTYLGMYDSTTVTASCNMSASKESVSQVKEYKPKIRAVVNLESVNNPGIALLRDGVLSRLATDKGNRL